MKTIIAIVTFFLSLSSFAQTLSITTPSPLPTGYVGTAYSVTLQATGGTPPYTWTWTGCTGACNTGLGFNGSTTSTTGVFNGTPANAGTSTFTFQVTDAANTSVSKSFDITISSSPPPNVYKFSCPGVFNGTLTIDANGNATVTASSITLNRGCTATKQ